MSRSWNASRAFVESQTPAFRPLSGPNRHVPLDLPANYAFRGLPFAAVPRFVAQ